MDVAPTLPAPAELRLCYLAVNATTLTVAAATRRGSGRCPRCGTATRRIHSHYTRRLADLPWHGMAVRLIVTTRRFFCDHPGCPRRIFTERLPRTAAPSARRTARLAATLDAIGLALGGAAGARLAEMLGMSVSGDTVRRLMLASPTYPAACRGPRVLGVDDWAWRRGQSYGTLLIDLEQRRVIDLLPDRTPGTFAAWLRAHPGVEIISRDRGGAYAEAGRVAAPEAIQVADRFHLLRNLTDAVDRAVVRHAGVVEDVAAVDSAVLPRSRLAVRRRRISGLPHNGGGPTLAEQRSAERRTRRLARYNAVVEQRKAGATVSAIARQTRLNRRTVMRWLAAEQFPERRPRRIRARRQLDPYANVILARYDAGLENASQLARELRGLGYAGTNASVRRYLMDLRQHRPRNLASTGPVRGPPRYTVRQTTWLLTRPDDACTADEQVYVDRLVAACPALGEARRLALALRLMLKTHDGAALSTWLAQARQTELRVFAHGIARDQDAVLAAILFQWSNGPVEGHVHRLKLIKRSMYGRAGFALLRQRVLRAA